MSNIHNETKLFKSLSWKQARLAVVSALVFGLFLSLIQIAIDYHQESNFANERIPLLFGAYKQTAARIAYNLDSNLAQELVDGLLTNKLVTKATLYDDQGNVIATAQKPSSPSLWATINHALSVPEYIPFTHRLYVPEDPEDAGKLVIHIDTTALYEEFRRRAVIVFFTGMVKSLLLSFVLFWLFNKCLTRHIVQIANKINSLSINYDFDAKSSLLIINSASAEDELGMLMRGINDLLLRIQNALADRNTIEQKLRTHQTTLEATVKDRTKELQNAHNELRLILAKTNNRVDEEKRRLSRQLHDSINPNLICIKLSLQKLTKQLSKENFEHHPKIHQTINSSLELISKTYTECRDIIKTTRIEILDTLGIVDAIDDLVESYNGLNDETDFTFEYTDNNHIPLAYHASVNIYRIVQEALLNIIKHSKAKTAVITLTRSSQNFYIVAVRDNGIGIQLNNQFGVGLIDMRERAKTLGSTLNIESKNNQGTIISFSFGLNQM